MWTQISPSKLRWTSLQFVNELSSDWTFLSWHKHGSWCVSVRQHTGEHRPACFSDLLSILWLQISVFLQKHTGALKDSSCRSDSAESLPGVPASRWDEARGASVCLRLYALFCTMFLNSVEPTPQCSTLLHQSCFLPFFLISYTENELPVNQVWIVSCDDPSLPLATYHDGFILSHSVDPALTY